MVTGAAALLGVAWACGSGTRAPGGAGGDAGDGGSAADNAGGSAGAPTALDAGIGGTAGSDAGAAGDAEPKFCSFDGERFTTYQFPSGEELRSFNVEQLRAFDALGVDSARGEVFVVSCAGARACQRTTPERQASLDVFSASDADFARPLRSIKLAAQDTVTDLVVDSSNDTLIVLVWETADDGTLISARSVTLARDATDLAAPIRELELGTAVGRLQLDAARNELYVFVPDEVRIYASDASGSAAPLRTVPLTASTSLLLSPARGEYHVRTGDTLETYALPASATPGTVLRTLTLPNSYDSIQFVDDVHGELWLGELELNVFDLTASGEAVSLRSAPQRTAPIGVLAEGDEVVFLRPEQDLGFYARTAISDEPRRIIEAAGNDFSQHLLSVDVQRDEVFFVSENGIVSVYPRDAAGDATPIRQLSTELRPGAAQLDPESAEILGTTGGEQVAYAADSAGQGEPSRRFSLQSNLEPVQFSLGHIDRAHAELLGVVEASGFEVVYLEPNADAYDWAPRYAAFSLTGSTPAVAIPYRPSRPGVAPLCTISTEKTRRVASSA